jgi:hypothetical protein
MHEWYIFPLKFLLFSYYSRAICNEYNFHVVLLAAKIDLDGWSRIKLIGREGMLNSEYRWEHVA